MESAGTSKVTIRAAAITILRGSPQNLTSKGPRKTLINSWTRNRLGKETRVIGAAAATPSEKAITDTELTPGREHAPL